MVVDKRKDRLLICARLYPQDSETGLKLLYTEASLSYTDDQGRSLFKYPGDVMFHIILTSETLLMNQRPLQYTTAAVSVTAANFAVNAAAAVYVASAVAAVFNAAAAFTVIAAIVTVTAAVYVVSTVFTIFTATTAVSVSSASASDRSPHSVSSVRLWSYYPLAPFPQSVTSL
jgi:hypothetical protein